MVSAAEGCADHFVKWGGRDPIFYLNKEQSTFIPLFPVGWYVVFFPVRIGLKGWGEGSF